MGVIKIHGDLMNAAANAHVLLNKLSISCKKRSFGFKKMVCCVSQVCAFTGAKIQGLLFGGLCLSEEMKNFS